MLLINHGPFFDYNNRTGSMTMLGYAWSALVFEEHVGYYRTITLAVRTPTALLSTR